MSLVERRHLEPQSGTALELSRGQTLRIIDPMGEQVADVTAFAGADGREWLSSGRSFDYNDTIYMTTGHTLWSNRSNPLLVIGEDRVGRHDFLLTPCSPEMFRMLYEVQGHHPSCFENLATNLAAFGIAPDSIPTTFNVFMNVVVAADGRLHIEPPRSRAGDFIDLHAQLDLIVGVTACSAEKSNNGALKPIEVQVREEQ